MARRLSIRRRGDEGSATAEYSVVAVAACGFGGLLAKLLSSHSVWQMLLKVLLRAFEVVF